MIRNKGGAVVTIILGIAFLTVLSFAYFADVHIQTLIKERNETLDQLTIQVEDPQKTVISIEALGATNKVPDVIALFETTLASRITSSAITMTLTSATDKDGNTLASSTYAFIIDEGTSKEEFVIADCTGTACTNMTRGLSVLTGTTTVSALQKAHGRGASVKITDEPILLILNRLAQGIDTYPNLLAYVSGTNCSAGSDGGTICEKTYIDNVAVQGSPTSTEAVAGITRLATQVQMALSTDAGVDDPLAIQGKFATSSPDGTSASGLYVLVSENDGKINQLWLDLTEAVTTTGAYTFNAQTNVFTNASPLIGIGTSSPYAPLSVVGEIVASFITATSTTATSTYSGGVAAAQFAATDATATTTFAGGVTGALSGRDVVTDVTAISASSGNYTATASCTTGKVPIGGGVNAPTGSSYNVSYSYPTGSGFTASVFCGAGGACTGNVTAYAICVYE